MKIIGFALALVLATAGSAHAGEKDKGNVTYVGGGRYTCTGNSAACAQVKQNNEALEANRRAANEARRAREESARSGYGSNTAGAARSYSWERDTGSRR